MAWGASIIGVGSVLSLLDDVQVRWGEDVVYVVGSNVKYGVFLETGTSKMPAYPWFRPAINEYRRNPTGFIRRNTNTNLGNIESVGGMVRTVALALERQMKKNVAADQGGRSPGTHPDHPQVQTGNLRASIRAERIR